MYIIISKKLLILIGKSGWL